MTQIPLSVLLAIAVALSAIPDVQTTAAKTTIEVPEEMVDVLEKCAKMIEWSHTRRWILREIGRPEHGELQE